MSNLICEEVLLRLGIVLYMTVGKQAEKWVTIFHRIFIAVDQFAQTKISIISSGRKKHQEGKQVC